MKTILTTILTGCLASALGLAAQSPPALPPSPAPPPPALPAPPAPSRQMVAIKPSASATNAALTALDDMPTNSFNFPSLDVNQFLSIYADLIGRTILRPASLPAPSITLKTQTPLTRKESIQAFDTLLAMNGITIIKIGEKFVKAVPSATAFQEAAPFSTLDPDALPETGQYNVHLVQLKYTKPTELMPVLQQFGKIPNGVYGIDSSQVLVIRDYAENVRRMLEIIKQIDIAVPAEFVSEVIPIKYALASDISSALNSLSSGGGGGGASIGRSSTAARTTTSRPTTPGYPGGMTQPGMGVATPFGTTGATSTPGTTPAGSSSFTDRLKSIVQRASSMGDLQIIGQTKIIADERTNSLLVFATREDMKMIKDIIGKLDVVLAQVLIEAVILEVALGDSLNYGVSWLKRPDTLSKFTGAGVIQNSPAFRDPSDIGGVLGSSDTNNIFQKGLSWWGKYDQSFDVVVQAAAEDSHVNVLSRPRIQTSHAVPAAITIGISRPIITGQYSYYGGPQSQYQYQNFGITLNVTPLINPDGLVVMDIDQQIQNVGRDIPVDANFSMPEVTTRSATAKVAVRNHDTIMLGGFISTQVSESKTGVPILKDIPLLRHLFTSNAKKHDRSELIVLIRPTVLETPEIAAQVAAEERSRLPGIRRAEAEGQIQEEKLMLSAEIKRAEAAGQLEQQPSLPSQALPSQAEMELFNRVTPITPEQKKALDGGEAPPQ